jgi:hypothetical protein
MLEMKYDMNSETKSTDQDFYKEAYILLKE